jgi:hypothetical protein
MYYDWEKCIISATTGSPPNIHSWPNNADMSVNDPKRSFAYADNSLKRISRPYLSQAAINLKMFISRCNSAPLFTITETG